MENVKKCPFCGGEGVLQKSINDLPIEFFVYCRNCNMETQLFKTTEEALAFWNTRNG